MTQFDINCVFYRKQTVDQQAQELHNLEARLRETEERLRVSHAKPTIAAPNHHLVMQSILG